MTLKKFSWTLLAIFAIYSCNSGANNKVASERAIVLNNEITDETRVEKVETPIERKIIKEGVITFETVDLKRTESLITETVNEMGGYVASDNVFSNANRITHRMTVRVAADKFDQLLAKISESAEKLDRKTISALDVTEEYIDVEARLKTKKELESRYKELLIKAKTVEDLLSIEKEIGTLRTEIESIEGRLGYLQDRVSLSSLTIEYYKMTAASSFGFPAFFTRST